VAVHIRRAAVAVGAGVCRSAQEPARGPRDLVARGEDGAAEGESGPQGDTQGPESSGHLPTIS
jgi:hypothetical protein